MSSKVGHVWSMLNTPLAKKQQERIEYQLTHALPHIGEVALPCGSIDGQLKTIATFEPVFGHAFLKIETTTPNTPFNTAYICLNPIQEVPSTVPMAEDTEIILDKIEDVLDKAFEIKSELSQKGIHVGVNQHEYQDDALGVIHYQIGLFIPKTRPAEHNNQVIAESNSDQLELFLRYALEHKWINEQTSYAQLNDAFGAALIYKVMGLKKPDPTSCDI